MAAGSRSPQQLLQGRLAVEAANRVAAHANDRERGYINAVAKLYGGSGNVPQRARIAAYELAMRDLVAKQPADTEAKIFHAISLAASALPSDKTYAGQKKAGSILETLWKNQPGHPGIAHYIIHTYDYPALASEAAAAARSYATIAPSAAHALHMPSHIFTRTGLWRESIDMNLRSARVAMTTGSIAEALHASDYATYAYLQMRSESAARGIVDKLPALAARLEPKASAFPWTEAMTHFARALGASRTGDFAKARGSIRSRQFAIGSPLAMSRIGVSR